MINRTWLSLGLAVLPGLALAGVNTGLPAVNPFSSQQGRPPIQPAGAKTGSAHPSTTSSASGGTTSAGQKVPAISPEAAERIAAVQVWQQSIATPPEGPESAATRALARQSLTASQAMDDTLPVISGANGTVDSLAGRPVLVCSPLHTCIIELPDGIRPVTTVGISKSEWNVQQALVGKQPEIFLSPKFTGLHQNIVVAATDQGRPINYEIRLVSDAVHYIPALKIEDSGGEVRSWKTDLPSAGSQAAALQTADNAPTDPSTADPKGNVLPLPNIRLNHVNLRWSIHCGGGGWFRSSDCKPIRPLRVYDDGTHTFIDMPQGLASHGGFPILQARNASGHLIGVNTQIRGNTYVVDSVPAEILLRLGSEVVTIQQEER
ncbi:TrbG/VirB9 family P-type conjugative transfer protein [Acidithiobacillus sp. HP-6]|uniref:TrbG/VirB9 family P-type conjugative transfer protein n=1 Tax=unclassified Acidithiobacillus TaxID=2614800 RepID=UPI00187ACB49|nr:MULTISPECIES: TrbG/VirB9 family P-type conjugative transfer protein [unclassified Acidithiobacillus]MBE7564202.1 TrbG/VirB9 family P-type conjugative transfer protein [Acidithiobacillus sp. HP-6]MBE7569120.1 TrbG/VirB9 family P-type conjugative transfer protein [Acidithiobacillus sp. HP-2]